MITDQILEKLGSGAAPGLKLDASRCLRMRLEDSSCSRCRTVCTAGAIDLSAGLKVRKERCTGCLACTTACPSGAIEAHEDFSAILSALAGHRLPVFVLGCPVTASRSHKQLPCLGMLSAEHLVGLYATGEALVRLAADACCGCPAGLVSEQLGLRLRDTARSTRLPLERRIRLVYSEEDAGFLQEGLDRRSFFSSLRRSAFQGVVEALGPARKEKPPASYMDKTLPRRRATLLTAIEALPAHEAGTVRDAFTFSVAFNDSCDGCLGCVRACPTGAITENNDSSPRFDSSRCTGCMLCTEFCLSNAVAIVPQDRS